MKHTVVSGPQLRNASCLLDLQDMGIIMASISEGYVKLSYVLYFKNKAQQ